MKRYYLVSTEHLENGLWFRDEEDFRVAMNYVAIQAARHPEVVVLAFILMSNHVHFVLRGRKEDVIAFLNQFKHRYSIYYGKKYLAKEFLRGNSLDIRPIFTDNEGLEKAIAYVQMNCVAAGICAHPSQYEWGSGNSYFSSAKPSRRFLKDLTGRELTRLMHSRCHPYPNDWIIGDKGYILPESFVDVSKVESVFHTPQRMNFFLRNSSKARKKLESDVNAPAFRDQTIVSALPDLCRSLFQKGTVAELLAEELSELARQIRFRFCSDATQIARVCGVSYSDVARLLDECS